MVLTMIIIFELMSFYRQIVVTPKNVGKWFGLDGLSLLFKMYLIFFCLKKSTSVFILP